MLEYPTLCIEQTLKILGLTRHGRWPEDGAGAHRQDYGSRVAKLPSWLPGVKNAEYAARTLDKLLPICPLLEPCRSFLVAEIEQAEAYFRQVKYLVSAPPAPGHEAFFRQLGYDPLRAVMEARAVIHFGKRLAEERNNIIKPLASVFHRLSRHSGKSLLVISRRAKELKLLLDLGVPKPVVEKAIAKASLSLTFAEFGRIVERATSREEQACRRLEEIAQSMRPYIPDPRGKPISVSTAIHFMLCHELKNSGQERAYTWSPSEEDFTDPATKATRATLADNDFDPRPAIRLLKSDVF
jgi:hypothetical protein